MIDIACFGGSSGSPVILIDEDTYSSKKKGGLYMGNRLLLLGTLYAGPILSLQGDIVIQNIPTVQKPISVSRIPTNSYV